MPSLVQPRSLLGAVVVALLFSCSNPLDGCACSPLPPSGVLHGEVSNPHAGSGWRESEPSPFAMWFSLEEQRDSVRVDLVLRVE